MGSEPAFSGIARNVVECGETGVVTIGSKLVSGNGNPRPGDCGPWVYRITVQSCTGCDLTGVKVQGGTSGWTNFVSATGYYDGGPTTISKKKSNGAGGATTVITWTGNLNIGDTLDIDVTVNGCLKSSQVCNLCATLDDPVAGSVLFLSGPWSAAYTDCVSRLATKSDYTPRVSVEAVCQDPTDCL